MQQNSIQHEGRQVQLPGQQQLPGGRFDFDDGGMYCGGWEEGKATGHGICTGPRNQGEYAGSWHLGFEVSGCYTWPSGNTFSGQWQNGKRHGLGVETRGRWIYRGEWNQGLKGRYGTRCSLTTGAKYEGTFSNGLQDGYGTETYADGGTFQGQWLRGLRHGYGIRVSAPFATASLQRKKSLHSQPSVEPAETQVPEEEQEDPAADRDHKIEQNRGGFILKAHSEEPTVEKKRKTFAERKDQMKNSIISGLRLKKQRSTGDIDTQRTPNHHSHGSLRSARSNSSFNSSQDSGGMTSAVSEGNVSFISQDEILDPNITETYMGEWKNDKRAGFGVAERSDGLKYEGEWQHNRKYGYGVTYFKDGTKEEGKYKNNILISSQKKKATFMIRASKIREKIDQAASSAQRAAQIAMQKADIAMNRTATARGKAEQAEIAAMNAKEDAEIARAYASQFGPDFRQGDQPQFHTVISQIDSVAHQRAQSLYGPRKPVTAVPDNRMRSSVTDEETFMPSGIAARIGGRLTVDDAYVADQPTGSRRHSLVPPMSDEDYAPEQFLNRHSPRQTSMRESVRSHRSSRTPEGSLAAQKAQAQALLNPRRMDHGTTSVMQTTVMEMPGDTSATLGPRSNLPVPELKYTDTGSPYYTATPNPALLTPLHVNQLGTPEYMQQVADKLSVQQGNLLRPSNYGPHLVDSSTSTQQYHPIRTAPPPMSPLNRRSTLPAAIPEPILQIAVPPKPPRTPQSQMTTIQESRNGSTGSSLNNRTIVHSPSDATILTKTSVGTLPRQPSQEAPSGRSSQTGVNSSRSNLSRNPALGKIPKLGSINMGGSFRVSMPDIFEAATVEAPPPLSREEVSRLSSERRETVRKMKEEEERIRRNPLLFIFHPAVKEFLYRHHLILLVGLLNMILFYLFMDLLHGND